MSTASINLRTFTNSQWGQYDNGEGNRHYAYLNIWEHMNNCDVIVGFAQYPSLSEVIEKLNTVIQESRPFHIKDSKNYIGETMSYELDDRKVTWDESDVPTRQKIVEKYVLAKLRTVGQDEQPPLAVNVDGLAALIDYDFVPVEPDQPDQPAQTVVDQPPLLPATNEWLGVLFSRQLTTEDTDFLSCSSRVKCLINAFFCFGGIVFVPVMTIYECFTEDKWSNLGWRILDTSLCVLITPIICVVKMIQCLAGAILHPTLALR